MKNINIKRIYYHIRHQYMTMNNLVVAAALFIAIGWAWGSVSVMERNYSLQHTVDHKERELQLAQLETDTLRYQQKYYQSDEYKELAVRKRLGLVAPGESVLILPANSATAKAYDDQTTKTVSRVVAKPANFQQWVTFLFGGNQRGLQD